MEISREYISAEFAEKLWPLFEEEYKDRQHTLKNYKNILQAFCRFIRKDFLKAREEDVAAYYAELKDRCAKGAMSSRSMLTYQKTLRAIAYKTEEYIQKKNLTVFFVNFFKETVASDVREITEDLWIAKPMEISGIIMQAKNAREVMILLMLTEGGITASQIEKMRWGSIVTTSEGKWLSYDGEHGFYMSDFCVLTYKDFLQEEMALGRYKPDGYMFYGNWDNIINTKNISTLIKRCRNKAAVRDVTARQLRDYALLLRLDDLLNSGEEEFNTRVCLDDMQKTRMRELYQWMIKNNIISDIS